jgi:hypothetical protein
MSGISSLGYLGLGVKDVAGWEKFATQIRPAERGRQGGRYATAQDG